MHVELWLARRSIGIGEDEDSSEIFHTFLFEFSDGFLEIVDELIVDERGLLQIRFVLLEAIKRCEYKDFILNFSESFKDFNSVFDDVFEVAEFVSEIVLMVDFVTEHLTARQKKIEQGNVEIIFSIGNGII